MLDLALAQLPEHARPTPSSLQDQGGPQILIRADSAGTTRAFLAGCRQRGVRYSVGLAVDQRIQDAITLVPADAWQPAISTDGTVRDNGEIVELTELLDLSAWPAGSRVICRRERPHPGAQYRFTDIDGHRFQGLLTDTPGRGNDIADLELRHRQHARVEDRIRNGKDRGMRNLPSVILSQPVDHASELVVCVVGGVREVVGPGRWSARSGQFRARLVGRVARTSGAEGRRCALVAEGLGERVT